VNPLQRLGLQTTGSPGDLKELPVQISLEDKSLGRGRGADDDALHMCLENSVFDVCGCR
jgi:hypothetical protein